MRCGAAPDKVSIDQREHEQPGPITTYECWPAEASFRRALRGVPGASSLRSDETKHVRPVSWRSGAVSSSRARVRRDELETDGADAPLASSSHARLPPSRLDILSRGTVGHQVGHSGHARWEEGTGGRLRGRQRGLRGRRGHLQGGLRWQEEEVGAGYRYNGSQRSLSSLVTTESGRRWEGDQGRARKGS